MEMELYFMYLAVIEIRWFYTCFALFR